MSSTQQKNMANVLSGNREENAARTVRIKRKSKVWDEFTGSKKAICKHCGLHLCGRGTDGTSHLRRHLEKHCKIRPKDENINFQSSKSLVIAEHTTVVGPEKVLHSPEIIVASVAPCSSWEDNVVAKRACFNKEKQLKRPNEGVGLVSMNKNLRPHLPIQSYKNRIIEHNSGTSRFLIKDSSRTYSVLQFHEMVVALFNFGLEIDLEGTCYTSPLERCPSPIIDLDEFSDTVPSDRCPSPMISRPDYQICLDFYISDNNYRCQSPLERCTSPIICPLERCPSPIIYPLERCPSPIIRPLERCPRPIIYLDEFSDIVPLDRCPSPMISWPDYQMCLDFYTSDANDTDEM